MKKKTGYFILIASIITYFCCLVVFLPEARKFLIYAAERIVFDHPLNYDKWMYKLVSYAIYVICVVGIIDFYYFFLRKEIGKIKNNLTTEDIIKIKKKFGYFILIASIITYFCCLVVFLPEARKFLIYAAERIVFDHPLNYDKWMYKLVSYAIYVICVVGIIDFYYFFLRKEISKIQKEPTFLRPTSITINKTDVSFVEKVKDYPFCLLGAIGVFAAVYVFFVNIHPPFPYITDDWLNYSLFGGVIPNPRAWNPARILVAFFLPLSGYIASYIIYPIQGDYINSMIITGGITISCFCVAFYISLYRLFLALSNNKNISVFSTLLFFGFCFVIVKSKSGSAFMLETLSQTGFWAYTIPNIINSIAVCFFMRNEFEGKNITVKEKGVYRFALILIGLYFSVFSGLFSAAMLASYCFCHLLISIFHCKCKGLFQKLKHYIKYEIQKHGIYIFVICLFLVFAFLEACGARAHAGYVSFKEYPHEVLAAIRRFPTLLQDMNSMFVMTFVITAIIALMVYIQKRNVKPKNYVSNIGLICVISLLFMFVFDVLVIAKEGIHQQYITEPTIVYNIFFYYILLVSFLIVYIIKNIPKLFILYLCSLIIIFSEIVNPNSEYRELYPELSFYQKKHLYDSWIDQIKQADNTNETSVTIQVPKSNEAYNWPHNIVSFAYWFPETLYNHHIIHKRIKVILELVEMNEIIKNINKSRKSADFTD